MRKGTAAAGSSLFFALEPGIFAGAMPWWLTHWRVRHLPAYGAPLRAVGVILLAAGAVVLVRAFARFVAEGVGTPAPIAPTRHLVVGGLYSYVRNPMYLAVIAAIAGQALLLWQPSLLAYGALVGCAMFGFARWCEEPMLRESFGAEYEAYRAAVPGWWPRVHPWHGRDTPGRPPGRPPGRSR